MIGVRIDPIDGGEEVTSCTAFVDCRVWITERESADWGDLTGEFVMFFWKKGIEKRKSFEREMLMQVTDIDECIDIGKESVGLEECDLFTIRKVEYSQFERQVALAGVSGRKTSAHKLETEISSFRIDKEDVVLRVNPPSVGLQLNHLASLNTRNHSSLQ
jgi:hypothetical protein